MAERAGLITLDGFIHKYLDKKAIDDDQYHRYRVIATDGLKHLSIHHMTVVKKVELTIDADTLTADFPTDYVDYVGLLIEIDGRWWNISRDDKLVDGTLDNVTAEDVGEFEFGQGFAQPGGVNYYHYFPDFENRRFIFNGTSGKVVVLKYKSSGVEVVAYGSAADIQIPIEAEEALEDYIQWQLAEYDDEAEHKITRKKRDFDDSVILLRRIGDYSIMELRQLMYGTMTQTTNR